MAETSFLGDPPPRHTPLLADLARWTAQDWLRPLDHSFAVFLAQRAPDADPLLIFAAALASHQLGQGHACLDLQKTLASVSAGHSLDLPFLGEATPQATHATLPAHPLLSGLTLKRWLTALKHPGLVGHGPGATPLVLVGHRLYLRRYWHYEQTVRQAIAQRVAQTPLADAPVLQAELVGTLDVLFPPPDPREGERCDWQKVACALAVEQGFCIITGGPGTGKTTTVVRLLAVLQHLALFDATGGHRPLRIRLAAPTGKAAARLNASIAGAVAGLPLSGLPQADAVRAAIPTEVTTVHRLLGARPATRRFVHGVQRPLPLEVLVIDEASMLDLEMMAAVCLALPPRARLILLGDKDQLASVEAGAVLGDLCAGFDKAVVQLKVSHRFGANSGIGKLAEAVNAGDGVAVQDVLDGGCHADVFWLPRSDDAEAFKRLILKGYRPYLDVMRKRQPPSEAPQTAFDAWARDVLKAYGQFQLLCALRSGFHGVEGLNARIVHLLRAARWLGEEQGGGWYLGRPVLVTRNDYNLGLMNGDVGITLALPHRATHESPPRWLLRVAFPANDSPEGIRWVLPSRLHAIDTVFAMTVHKSQGSEFAHAALFLPPRLNPALTRELIYTGITRARHQLTLMAAHDVLQAAIQRRVDRVGGLS